MTVEKLLRFANLLGTGWLKTWKAHSMIGQYQRGFDSLEDEEIRRWVHNCLKMEGFSDSDCDKIFEFLHKGE